jgi:hypothetical protein
VNQSLELGYGRHAGPEKYNLISYVKSDLN